MRKQDRHARILGYIGMKELLVEMYVYRRMQADGIAWMLGLTKQRVTQMVAEYGLQRGKTR